MKPPKPPSGDPKKSRNRQSRLKLQYPKHVFRPEDLLDFIELPVFTKRWKKLGLDDEQDLCALQLMIMANPHAGPVIPGTRGIRKLRFAPSDWNCGASGAARVLYAYLEEFGIVVLALVYGKNEVDDISDAGKKQLSGCIVEIENEMRRRQSINSIN